MEFTAVRPGHGMEVAAEADVVLDADPGVSVGDVAAELGSVLDRGGYGPPRLYVGGFPVEAEVSLGDSPLRDGILVSLDDPSGCAPPEPNGLVEIRVIGGVAAGGAVRLGPGEAVVGSGPGAWIGIEDDELPAEALRLTVGLDVSVTVETLGGVPAAVDGEPLVVGAARPWQRGTVLRVGRSLLAWAVPDHPDAPLKPSEDGAGLDYNRPPRLLPPEQDTRFQLPSAPLQSDARPLPIIAATLPVVAAVALSLVMHSWAMLALAAFTPIALVGNYISDRRYGRKSFRRQQTEHAERLASVESDARAALTAEQGRARFRCPDAAWVRLIATGPRRRLWERRRSDADFLLLRVGTGTLPSAVVLNDPNLEEHRRTVNWPMPDVPVAVSLRERGVLGVAGRAELPRAVGRWLVAQAAVLHSPNDLRIVVLTDSSGRASWDWVRWLPHARPDGGTAIAAIGNDAETVARRVAELISLVTERQAVRREQGSSARFAGPETLVILDGARRLRSLPGVAQVLRDGPSVGVHLVCLDADVGQLPAECAVVAVESAVAPAPAASPPGSLWSAGMFPPVPGPAPAGLLRVEQSQTDAVDSVLPDGVSPAWCEDVARRLAPLRDVSGNDDQGALPDACRLLDVLGLEPPSADGIAARWSLAGRTTQAVIGVWYDGAFTLDLKEHGPHGLVAGTTGSGKSELLQSLVASLAVANRPDAMTFVLVDYKGGSAFKDCVHLPHTVGMVTDLDTHLVERALASLGAELRRREHILAAAGAKDIEDYTSAAARDDSLAPLPRLVLVIDEFASLARELPDFVTGLVNIAQRGRSLGIHLILATQRPGGVVSPEIRANTNLRIALRVTDVAESSDVIDAPDAARIQTRTPGRAYARLGHASLVPFQAARVGGRRPTATATAGRPWIASWDWEDTGRPPPRRPNAKGGADEEHTDLAELVASVSTAASLLGVPEQHRPWLDALPHSILLDDLLPESARPSRAPELIPRQARSEPVDVHPTPLTSRQPPGYDTWYHSVPEVSAPEDSAPEDSAPEDSAPEDSAPGDSVSGDSMSEDLTQAWVWEPPTEPADVPPSVPGDVPDVSAPRLSAPAEEDRTRPWAPADEPADAVPDTRAGAASPSGASDWGRPVPGAAGGGASRDGMHPVPYGMEDLPGEQRQRVAAINLPTFSHLFAIGAPHSGRSQLLRTIAGSCALTNSARDLHLYGIDCGNGALLPLIGLPHTGAVVRSSEPERTRRLLGRLGAEVRRRMDLLAQSGFSDITEQRTAAAPDDKLPHVVVLLDRWEGFTSTVGELDGGQPVENVLQLLREGASVGVHVIATGDRSLMLGRISTMTEHKLVLRMADRADFSLVGVNPNKLPDELPSGRAFRAETAVETHIALLVPDPSGQAQAAALAHAGGEARDRDPSIPRQRRPFRIDDLPSRVSVDDAWKLRDPENRGPLWGLVGVGGDDLTAYGADMAVGTPAFVIAGPARSGRSTALIAMARSFLAEGAQLVLAVPRETSPLAVLDGEPGVVAVLRGEELGVEQFTEAVAALTGPGVIVVDDAELLRSCDASDELTRVIRGTLRPATAIVLAGDAEQVCSGFTGWQIEAKKARRGLLLSPQSVMDGQLVGVVLSRSSVGDPVRPGRGLLHLGDGEPVTVQVPMG